MFVAPAPPAGAVRVRQPGPARGWALRPVPPSRRLLVAAAGLIVAQLSVRGWVAGRGYFYWDDLILVGRAGRYPLWSPDLLLYDHDGHFMPAAFATAWVVTTLAPMAWAGPLVSLLALQCAASMAVLRMLIVLGRTALPGPAADAAPRLRWAVLLPLTFYLFCPLTLPAFAWWAAALNALPLQFALAWLIGDAVLLVRTGRRRYAVTGAVVFVVALLFFEKSVLVPFVAFAVAALHRYVGGCAHAVRVVLRRGAALWVASGLVLLGWAAVYRAVAHAATVRGDPGNLRNLLHSATSLGIVPALLGGPWVWARWLPSTPWAAPPGWAVLPAWIVLGVVVVLSIRARRRVLPVWLVAAGYVLAAQLPVALIRGGPNTAAEVMQSLRYLADVAVPLTAVGALVVQARPRRCDGRLGTGIAAPFRGRARPSPSGATGLGALGTGSRRPGSAGGSVRAFAAVTLAVLFIASSLWSTGAFARSWSISPTRTYLTNVRSGLAASDGAPLLEQEVPWNVLTPLAYPQNLASRVLGPVAPPGTFADSTPRLRMITDTGEIVDAQVWWNRSITPGPEPGCGYRVDDAPVELALDGPMLEHGWTAQLNYFASQDGRVTVAFEHGRAVVVPVRAGLHTVFVRLVGGGDTLLIAARTPGLDVCVGVGPVGVAAFAR
jgi:hypothetical protein